VRIFAALFHVLLILLSEGWKCDGFAIWNQPPPGSRGITLILDAAQ
jgi:hypothetical protein